MFLNINPKIKYSEEYVTFYDLQYTKTSNEIKEMLINFKKEQIHYNHAHNQINIHFNDIINNYFCDNDILKELNNLFKNERTKYEYKYWLNCLSKDIEPIFNKKNIKNITFDKFIKDSAQKEAIEFCKNNFRNSYKIFEWMYDLNKFDGYKNMPEFRIQKSSKTTETSGIFKEICSLKFPDENHLQKKNEILNEDYPIIIENSNKIGIFHLKKEYQKVFESEELYNHFTDYYIDKKHSTYEDFKDVFLNPSPTKYIQFVSTAEFSYLLDQLEKNFFRHFQQKLLNQHKIFKSNKAFLSQSNYSKSKKHPDDEIIANVEDTISFIKKRNQKS